MQKRAKHFLIRPAVSFSLLLLAGMAAGAQVKTRRLTAGEVAEMKAKLESVAVPGRVGPLLLDASQTFAVEGSGYESFWIGSARYDSNEPDATVSIKKCGVFIVGPKRAAQYVPTIGYEWTNGLRCNGLNGIGFVSGEEGLPPRVLLEYATASPNYAVKEPVVLDWNAAEGKYFDNEKLSRRLEDDDRATNILTMKRQLKSY